MSATISHHSALVYTMVLVSAADRDMTDLELATMADIVRMLPIFLSLAGSGEKTPTKLFLGWFGPRGLASVVFAIIVLNADIPGGRMLASVVTATVFLSLILHGLTAKPFAALLEKRQI